MSDICALLQSIKAAGRNQNQQGQEQEAKGQVNDYVGGIGDRVSGTVGEAFSSVTGNERAKAEYRDQHAEGKTQQRGAEHDILKKAEAERDAEKPTF